MKKVKVGIVQMIIETSPFGKKHKVRNLSRAEYLINKLVESEEDIDIVVLPEEFLSGSSYNFTNIPFKKEYLENKVLANLREISRKNRCYIVGSVIVADDSKVCKDKRYKNLGFIIDRNGEVIGYQGKFSLFDEEKEYVKPDDEYNIFDLDIGKVGIVVGTDNFYPEIIRNIALKGVDIVICPALVAQLDNRNNDVERNLLVKMARESVISAAMQNQIFTIFVNGIGNSTYIDGKFIGESLVASPLGNVQSFMDNECVKVIEIDKKDIEVAKSIIPIMNIRNTMVCAIDKNN